MITELETYLSYDHLISGSFNTINSRYELFSTHNGVEINQASCISLESGLLKLMGINFSGNDMEFPHLEELNLLREWVHESKGNDFSLDSYVVRNTGSRRSSYAKRLFSAELDDISHEYEKTGLDDTLFGAIASAYADLKHPVKKPAA